MKKKLSPKKECIIGRGVPLIIDSNKLPPTPKQIINKQIQLGTSLYFKSVYELINADKNKINKSFSG